MVYIDVIMKKTMDFEHLYIACIVNMLSIYGMYIRHFYL